MHPDTFKSFKALGILLCYPREEWVSHVLELCDLIDQEQLLPIDDAQAIRGFAHGLLGADMYAAQEAYVDTFDRVRSLSLHLFEHVHGESRDRGQAMVDLLELYKESDLALDANELPDFLPVFLEHLSLLPKAEALEMLAEPVMVLKALGKRLAERGSNYHVLFDALVRLASHIPEKVECLIEPTQPSFAALDKEWEEKPVDFLGAEDPQASGGCGSGGGSCGSGGCSGGAKPAEGARP